MSDDEPDYMSDAFLAQCLPQDVKPGLKRTHADKRSHELLRKKEEERERAATKEPKKTKKELEEEMRQEGLQKSIDESNKGFAMLQKMGYKAGESLGKSNVGMKEPISIVVKSDRGGLGRAEALRQIEAAKTEFRRRRLEELSRRQKESTMSMEEFRAQKSKQMKLKQVQTDLYKSQKACRQLDHSKNFEEPAETWFWPEQECRSTFEDDEDDEAENHNDVKRNARNDEDDEDDGDGSGEESDEVVDAVQLPVAHFDHVPVEVDQPELEPDEMLFILTGYLRTEHLYCVWCGITFSDPEDMSQNCPGSTKEDHDD